MIVKPSEADRLAKSPPRGIAAALVFGPDAGLVRERAETLLKTAVEDLNDPFRLSDLDGEVLANDPARLADEAAAISMLGGRRAVRVRGATNALASLFEDFLQSPPSEALVVAEAGDLPKSSALRRAFEEAENAFAIACYADTAQNLSDVVRDALRAEGFSIASDALADAVSRLGSDRGVTRRELEKLMLYAHGQKQISLKDVRAVMGDEAEARVEEAVDAAGVGDLPRLDLALERLWAADISPVAVLRQAMSHFQRLLLVGAESQRGESLDNAMRKLRPPLHFMRTTSFKAQAQRWREAQLFEALDLLLEAEAQCKTTAMPARALCGRTLFQVAAMAKVKG
jgi:DNA polymerase-3 subunit delta